MSAWCSTAQSYPMFRVVLLLLALIFPPVRRHAFTTRLAPAPCAAATPGEYLYRSWWRNSWVFPEVT